MASFANAKDTPSPRARVGDVGDDLSPLFRGASTKIDFEQVGAGDAAGAEEKGAGNTASRRKRSTTVSAGHSQNSEESQETTLGDSSGADVAMDVWEEVPVAKKTRFGRADPADKTAIEPDSQEGDTTLEGDSEVAVARSRRGTVSKPASKPAPKPATKAAPKVAPKTAPKTAPKPPTPRARMTRSRSNTSSPAPASASDSARESPILATKKKRSNLSSLDQFTTTPTTSQTLPSSVVEIGDSQRDEDLMDTQMDMEVDADTQLDTQLDESDDIGTATPRLSETNIFSSAKKRKIKFLRTSTQSSGGKFAQPQSEPSATTSAAGAASNGATDAAGASASQITPELPRVNTSITTSMSTNRRTYGANRSYLADSPTKTESFYSSLDSDSGEESAHEELHIKSVHELRETGGNTRFMDEMEYLAEGLEDEGSSRRTTLLEICKKSKDGDFIRKLKSTDYADKILKVLPQVVDTDPVAAFLVLFIAQKIFEDNGANVLHSLVTDSSFLHSIFSSLQLTDSVLDDKKSSKVFKKVLGEFVSGTSGSTAAGNGGAAGPQPTPSPALAAIATLSTLQTYPGASGDAILQSCLEPSNWDKFSEFATAAFTARNYRVLQFVVLFLEFCQSDLFFSSLAGVLDDVSLQCESGEPETSLVDLSLPALRLLILLTNEETIPELNSAFVLKCVALAKTLFSHSSQPKLYEVYLLSLGFLANIIDSLTSDYRAVYDTFTQLDRGKSDDKHGKAFLVLLRKSVVTRGGLEISDQEKSELE